MKLGQIWVEGIAMAWKALRSNRLRALLTVLGVATGIFAITAILTLVNSMQTTLTSSISALGNTSLFVHHLPWTEERSAWYKFKNRPPVSFSDYTFTRNSLDRVVGISYEVSISNQLLQAEGRSIRNVTVTGSTHDLMLVRPLEFHSGRYFSEIESHVGRPVCLLGYSIAEGLFPGSNPIGRYIRMGRKRLLVIGTLSKQGSNLFGGPSDDEKLFVPYNLLSRIHNMSERRGMMIVRADTYENVPIVTENIRSLIRAGRGLKPDREDNFAINKQEALMNRFDKVFNYLEWGGVVISIFSILIGGFSIGNIMYISVRERNQEIGVQKALGATRGFVLFQFLAEAISLCLIGGMVGILMTVGLGLLIQLVVDATGIPLTVAFSPWHLFYGLAIAFVIGLIAGILPAASAARLDPVVAIRKN